MIEKIILSTVIPDPPIGIGYAGHHGEETSPLAHIEHFLSPLPEFRLGSFTGIKQPRQGDDIAEIILILVGFLVVNSTVIVHIFSEIFEITHPASPAESPQAARVHRPIEIALSVTREEPVEELLIVGLLADVAGVKIAPHDAGEM